MLLIAIIFVAMLVRYMYWTIEKHGEHLAKIEHDQTYREQEELRLTLLLEDKPNSLRLLRQRADLRYYGKNWPGIIDDLQKVVKLSPSDDTAWHELAEAQIMSGDYRSAFESASKAVEIDPGYADYYSCLTRANICLGNFESANKTAKTWADILDANAEKPAPKPTAGFHWARALSSSSNPDFLLSRSAIEQGANNIDAAKDFLKRALSEGAEMEELSRDPAYKKLSEIAAY
jgi:tetratricopeptide (TPR) repeat protein